MENQIEAAVKALKSGELVILPTETVYGIFADATSQTAVERLYAAKGRPTEKALNLNVASFATVLKYSKHQPEYLEKLVNAFLPGPLTIILEASNAVPEWIHIGKTTVGFRMPSVAATQAVIKEVGLLVGPSANLTGEASPVYFADLSTAIREKAALAVKDDTLHGLDTTILDLTQSPAQILRQGAISRAEILEKVPEIGEIAY
ncbi:MAG: threonylcarbamoyl-AMP synthase [Streptococcaceae bacterium]|jgi:L-threonylcarbamoyladenylate synthase|nr:threonylcarbamoyl-AMP synthase [Streptococcaceae bacterium]